MEPNRSVWGKVLSSTIHISAEHTQLLQFLQSRQLEKVSITIGTCTYSYFAWLSANDDSLCSRLRVNQLPCACSVLTKQSPVLSPSLDSSRSLLSHPTSIHPTASTGYTCWPAVQLSGSSRDLAHSPIYSTTFSPWVSMLKGETQFSKWLEWLNCFQHPNIHILNYIVKDCKLSTNLAQLYHVCKLLLDMQIIIKGLKSIGFYHN